MRLILAVIHDLQSKGMEISREFSGKTYDSKEDFYNEHDRGRSPICRIEGNSRRDNNIMTLSACPMKDLLDSASKDGRLPAHFDTIVDKWKNIYKNKGAILHPFCIVHQVIRTTVGESIRVGGKKLQIVQIACRSSKNGTVAYAEEGLKKYNLSREEVAKQIDGHCCMYGVE